MRRLVPLLAPLCLTGSNCEPSTNTPPANGAWAVEFAQDDPLTCHVAGHNTQVGTVDDGGYGPVVTDGVDGASVACETVDVGGNHFAVHARVEQAGSVLEVDVDDIGSGNGSDFPALASVRLTDPKTVNELAGDDCYAWFADGSGQAVMGGRAWFTFSCEAVSNASDSGCEIPVGYLVVMECAQN